MSLNKITAEGLNRYTKLMVTRRAVANNLLTGGGGREVAQLDKYIRVLRVAQDQLDDKTAGPSEVAKFIRNAHRQQKISEVNAHVQGVPFSSLLRLIDGAGPDDRLLLGNAFAGRMSGAKTEKGMAALRQAHVLNRIPVAIGLSSRGRHIEANELAGGTMPQEEVRGFLYSYVAKLSLLLQGPA
jgi:hypothetical protein